MKNRYLLMLLGMIMFCACSEKPSEEDHSNNTKQTARILLKASGKLYDYFKEHNKEHNEEHNEEHNDVHQKRSRTTFGLFDLTQFTDTLYVFRIQDITQNNSGYSAVGVDVVLKVADLKGSTNTQTRRLCLVTDKYGNLREIELNNNTEVGDTLIVTHLKNWKIINVVNLTLQNKAKAFLKQR